MKQLSPEDSDALDRLVSKMVTDAAPPGPCVTLQERIAEVNWSAYEHIFRIPGEERQGSAGLVLLDALRVVVNAARRCVVDAPWDEPVGIVDAAALRQALALVAPILGGAR